MTSETDNTSLHGQGRTTAVSQHQTVSPFLAMPYIKVTAEGVLKLLKKLISNEANEANGRVILPARSHENQFWPATRKIPPDTWE